MQHILYLINDLGWDKKNAIDFVNYYSKLNLRKELFARN